jgi:hypothetical protein
MLAARSRSARPGAAVDQALAEQEAERELLVVAGRAHRDRQRRPSTRISSGSSTATSSRWPSRSMTATLGRPSGHRR